MTTFDGWNTLPRKRPLSENELMHFRTKGSKNGVRRFQLQDGTWTPLGLKERKAREGWGEARKERKLAKKAARSEKRKAREAERAEKRRTSKVSGLTDAELKAKIERLKMENEYRELKRSPIRKAGAKFISDYLKNRSVKAERAYLDNKEKINREHEMAKLKEQTEQTRLRSEADRARAHADSDRAHADEVRANTDRIDIEQGTRMAKLKNEKRSLKLQNRRFVSDNTIRGGAKKLLNRILSGRGEQAATVMQGYGESHAAYTRGRTDAKIAKKQNKILTRQNRKLKAGEERAAIPGGVKNYFEYNYREKNKNKNKNQK